MDSTDTNSPLLTLTLKDLLKNISNAVVGAVSDMFTEESDLNDSDITIRVFIKENRYMYLALLVIILLIVANLFFSQE